MKDVFVSGENAGEGEAHSGQAVGVERKPLTRTPEEYSEVVRQEPRAESRLSSFMVCPNGVKFETQDSKERIILLLRKHAITNVGWVLATVMMALLPLLMVLVPSVAMLPIRYQFLGVMIWYLLVFGFAFERFLAWYFHVYIVTDERILDYDFYSLMYKRVSEAKLDRIEDVTYSMGGTLMNIFNYGDVFIQTAGESRELDFESVPKPDVIVKLLNELVIEEEREKHEGRVR